ncbi:MAG: SAVED domain-containing protein [Burkholderiaceae bacterium]|nr:SAVED domain-containing protein [Burkholderiaceae bacterium]
MQVLSDKQKPRAPQYFHNLFPGASVAASGKPIVRFGVANPTPHLVEDESDIQHFRMVFVKFMAEVRNMGYKHIHLFPAMPLSLAVELGRQLLPKVEPTIDVWDAQHGKFVQTLQLDFNHE